MKEGWKTKALEDLCSTFVDGNWIESKDQSLNGIRLIQTGNIGLGKFIDKQDKARYISEGTFKSLKCTEVHPGDILISRLPDPVGKACQIPSVIKDKMITGVDCTIVRLLPFTDSNFLLYFQMSETYLNQVKKLVSGTTRDRVSRKNLGTVQIPLPPLPEQQRIVSIIDEAFEVIDKAIENTQKNLQNTKELFESYLSSVSAEKVSLGSLVKITTGKLNSNASVEDGQYPFFTCSREVFAIDHYAFDLEAILLAGNNASGDFNVKHFNGKFNAYQRTYVITIKNEEEISYRFLYFQLTKGLKEFKEMSVGANTKFLKIGMIEELKISLPSLSEQQAIVGKLEMLSEKTTSIKNDYQQKLRDLEELKKSVLNKAFAGEL